MGKNGQISDRYSVGFDKIVEVQMIPIPKLADFVFMRGKITKKNSPPSLLDDDAIGPPRCLLGAEK